MNILFLYNYTIDPMRGGVEKVTKLLSDYFRSEENNVWFLSHKRTTDYGNDAQLYLPEANELITEKNLQFFQFVIDDKSIDVVINQSGLFEEMSRFAFYAKEKNVKLISVIHNSLLSPAVNFEVTFYKDLKRYHFTFIIPCIKNKAIKRLIIKCYASKKRKYYENLTRNSDLVVVLSAAYIKELEYILKTGTIDNVIAIPNPIIQHPYIDNKEKELLYVGRVNVGQKKVDVLLKIWSTIYKENPDWILNIVGGDEDFDEVKKMSDEMKLRNIYFRGFQDPAEYYTRASIFCLTSSFEGFPMTIIEAMSYSTAPILFDSFGAASEIIETGKNGVLIPAFDINQYVSELKSLMNDINRLNELRLEAHNKSNQYELINVGKKWTDAISGMLF